MTLRIAFFGAGELAWPYLEVLRSCADAKVIACCDPDAQFAERMASQWQAELYDVPGTMLTKACPDVLWACTTSSQLDKILRQAADQRIAFFVHPPGAKDLQSAEECAQVVEDANLVTSVGYSTPYRDVTCEAKEYLGENPIPLVVARWIREAAFSTLNELIWHEGASLMEALRFFCGAVKEVRALAAQETEGQACNLHVQFQSGTVASCTLSTLAHPKPQRELELIGVGWSLKFSQNWQQLHVEEMDKTTILKSLRNPVEDHVRAFLEAVINGSPKDVANGYAESVENLRICAEAIA